MTRYSQYVKKHARTIFEVIGLLGVILALLQLNLQQRQFVYELSQKPILEYSYRLIFSESDQQVIAEAVYELAEKYYDLIYEKAQASPNNHYLRIAESILPISSTIPARPISLEVVIHNKGVTSATKVRITLQMDRPITSLDVQSLEPYEVIKGGLGENAVTVEVDRMVANDSVTIIFGSERVESESQLDRIILDKSRSLPYISEDTGGTSFTEEWQSLEWYHLINLSYAPFPGFKYVAAQQPNIRIVVTSNEGAATISTTPTP